METAHRTSTARIAVRTTLLAAAIAGLAASVHAQQDFRSSTKQRTTPQPIFEGDAITYEIQLHNTGLAGGPVTFKDTIPDCLDASGFTPANVTLTPGPGTVTYDGATRILTVTYADIPVAGSQTITVTNLLAPPYNGGPIGGMPPCCNQGLIIAGAVFRTNDPDTPAPNDETCFWSASPAPTFHLSTKDVSPRTGIALGTPITYTLHIRNSGAGTATNVLVTDDMPECMSFLAFDQGRNVTVTPGPAPIINYDAFTHTLMMTFTTFPPVSMQTITINGLSAGTEQRDCCNQASIMSTETPTPVNTDDLAVMGLGDATCVDILPPATVSFANAEKTVSPAGPVAPGAAVTYTVIVPNSGTAQATNVVMTDVFPNCINDTAFSQANVTVTPGPATSVTFTPATHTLTVDFATIAATTAQTITMTGLTIAPGFTGNCCNQGNITATELVGGQPTDDPNSATLGDPTCVAVSTVPGVNFATSTKSASPANPLPGGPVTYTITVTNSGGAAATNVLVQDTLPDCLNHAAPGVSIMAPGGTPTYAEPNVSVTYPTLAAGASQTITIMVPAGQTNGQCCNQGQITSTEVTTPTPTVAPVGGSQCVTIGTVAAGNRLLRNAEFPVQPLLMIFTGPAGACGPPNDPGGISLDPFGPDCTPQPYPSVDDDDTHVISVASPTNDPAPSSILLAAGKLIFYQMDQAPSAANTLQLVKRVNAGDPSGFVIEIHWM